MNEPSHGHEPLGWALVAIQFAFLGALGLEVVRAGRPPGLFGVLGLVAGATGIAVVALASNALGRRLRAHPSPPADAVLRTGGVYGVVRHPIYLGLLLLGTACVLIARTPGAMVSAAGLAVVLHTKSRLEERLLAERFPDYAAYAARVPRFIPRLRGPRLPRS